MADRVDQHLDNYRLRHRLGTGGFGEVYLAEHIHRTKEPPVAIKILPPLAKDDLRRFLIEARIIRLKHPNIVQVLDFGVAGDTPFIVMEYAPNGTLRQRHPTGTRVSLDTVVTYVKQVAGALQYAHDERLIHRDVKPENMLIGAQNQILLSDFGIAVVAHSTLTQTPEKAIGTARYMAPEQWRGEPLTATDQYALGITVYEWLCGEHPFDGDILQLQFQHTQVPPPPLREKVPTIPREVEQVVMTALAKDPRQRFGSVQAFAQALAASSAPIKTKEQWLAEGVAHYDAGRYETALVAYDQALRLDPGYASAYHNRGLAYVALQRYDKAIADYNRALHFAPEDVTVYFNRDTVYHLSRRAVITGIGGAVGLAVAGSGLTWLLFPRTLPPTHAAWYDSNYLHKKSITINKVRSNLSNFPVLISLPGNSNSDLRTAANGGYVQNSHGYDIIFTDSTETVKLDHEIEKYNASTGEIEMWVRLPTLSATTDTVIYMYFGNSRISSSQENGRGVWDSNYQGVYHLSDNAANTTVKDSTSNNNGTAKQNTNIMTTTGKIGDALNFNGSSDYYSVSNIAFANTSFTIEMWAKETSFNLDHFLFYQGTLIGANDALILGFRSSNVFTISFDFDDFNTTAKYTDSNWHHWVATYDSSTKTRTLYRDGVSQSGTGAVASAQYQGSGSLTIGALPPYYYFPGALDEFRISTGIVRSSGWIATEYNNQSSPSTFYTVSSLISR